MSEFTQERSGARRKEDRAALVLSRIMPYWAVIAFVLTAFLGLVTYIHAQDMTRVANSEILNQQQQQALAALMTANALNSARLDRLERATGEQSDKLDQILKAVQWQAETRGRR